MNTTALIIEKLDEVWLRISSKDEFALMELHEYFTFTVPGYKFMRAYKEGRFDGKIRLFNLYHRRLYVGLLSELIKFSSTRGYPVILKDMPEFDTEKISKEKVNAFVSHLKAQKDGTALIPRDYQINAIFDCINASRKLILSPTSSGKSFIIYAVIMWYFFRLSAHQHILLVVPNLSLIQQMFSDFKEYALNLFDISNEIYMIYGGQNRNNFLNRKIIISTWQSIFRESKEWFANFDTIIFDEAHSCKAECLKGILENAISTSHKFGFTGTLEDAKAHVYVLQGLFGDIEKVISTSELMERGQIAQLKIKCLILEYTSDLKKIGVKLKYQDELDFIHTFSKRNTIVLKLLQSLDQQNTLVLFQRIELQGKPFFELCKTAFPDRRIVYISGEVTAEEREAIRKDTETHRNTIIVASFGTMSTGVSITSLQNVIFLSPYKSKIRVLQSIGRALRLNEHKEKATIYDIVDDLSWKQSKNHTLRHFIARTKIYDSEKFDYKIFRIKL